MAGARAGVTYGGLAGLQASIKESSTSVGLPGFKVLSFSDYAKPFAVPSVVVADAFKGKLVVDQKPAGEVGPRSLGEVPEEERGALVDQFYKKEEVYNRKEVREVGRQRDFAGEVEALDKEMGLGAFGEDALFGGAEAEVYIPERMTEVRPGQHAGTFADWGAQRQRMTPDEIADFENESQMGAERALDIAEGEQNGEEAEEYRSQVVEDYYGGVPGAELYEGESW